MKILMIRHGETDWNVVKRLQGSVDIPLNEAGKELARLTAQALAEVDIDEIYTSPLSRAKETAMIIKKDRDIPVYEDDRLREISFGIYEGMCSSKDNYEIPDSEFSYFFSKPESYNPPDKAESIEHLCERTTDFLRELVSREELQDKTVLISTHGAAIRGLLSSVLNFSKKDFWKGGVHKNCAVTTLDAHNGTVVLIEEAKVYY